MGSAESSSHDQVLDELLVGPVPVGVNKFILQTDAPDPSLIPQSDILGITVILVTCSYRDQEFARIGYYVNNEYKPFEGYNVEEHGEPDLHNLDLTKVIRQIVADKPRVTRFPIKWGGEGSNSSSEMEEEKDDHLMQEDDDDEEERVVEGRGQKGGFFMSPLRTQMESSQNIVSPDASCQTDAVMGM